MDPSDPDQRAPSGAAARLSAVELWAFRLVWAALGVLGGNALGQALDGRSGGVRIIAAAVCLVGWGGVLLAALVPSATSLTAARAVVPIALVGSVVVAASGTSAATGIGTIVLVLLATALVLSPDLGDHFVQSSAYGHERRLLLRPPVAYLFPTVLSWCVLCGSCIAGPLLLGARHWVAGVVLTAVAVAAAVLLWPRFHRLSRRWLVIVPAGVVVHDHLVLAETAMFPRADVAGMRLAPAGTEAADLTGPAAGHVIEIELRDFTTVTKAAAKAAPRGTALHVRSVLVAPTRPGRALVAAGGQRLPVG